MKILNFLGKSKTSTVLSSNGKVTVNGVTYEGNNITITNNEVLIDGKAVESSVSGVVKVKIEGTPAKVYSDASVEVKGDVLGDVDSGGSVNCGNIKGNVDAGGSVRCGTVGGSVDAGGSVRMGR
ncbi:hypothetical protein [Bacillus licheniformis]|uniref:hypothetical protein n=1 Tax=Bacillus licheniformis TaxID=1402 RepID=UPI000493E213|nr:hypothetical protein [Bacillus licheniformis]AYC51937.1 hypothetical protein C7M53_11795 [Bacillus licheniformis]KAA0813077.1 hypothetical protein EI978_07930 [Bacillus licheniformis]KAA0821265.1 hypothetical protein EI973_18935 [Bacillus licheniformis]KAA0826475.1 hypothetical protein EI976_05385 [Bacillus licheniformis]MEC2103665.1 hypothetical protein [Bacillus licheniformis]